MEKCSPVEMRNNLEIVDRFRAIGVDFVAIPVSNLANKNELISQSNDAMEAIISSCESD